MAQFKDHGPHPYVVNIGDEPLKLYSLYAPPHHAVGTVHETQADQDH